MKTSFVLLLIIAFKSDTGQTMLNLPKVIDSSQFKQKIQASISITALLILKQKEYTCRGCRIKKFTNVLLHTAKMINPRFKSQARGQNTRS